MDCTCPRCASGHTQRLAVIYAQGTLPMRGRPLQTTASHLAEPPKPMAYLGPSVVIFLTFLILGAIVLSRLPRDSWLAGGTLGNALQAAFVFAPVAAWVVLARRYNATHWRKHVSQWERSFRCNRCGEFFLVPAHH